MRILLIEDDRDLGASTQESLTQAGYTTDWVETAGHALNSISTEHFDLVVLDLGLPDLHGFQLIHRLRKKNENLPILILSARDSLESRVEGLDLGADDYLIKPVATAELCARIRVILRRHAQGTSNPIWQLGQLEIDTVGKRIKLNGESIDLSAREWTIIYYLASHFDRIVSKDQLMQALGGWEQDLSANAIEAYIHRVRQKIGNADVHIKTIRGLGYLFCERTANE